MRPMLLAFLTAAAPLAGLGLLQLQARLERWDYERRRGLARRPSSR
ncbi:Uncharacterised protein [Mycobacterium tuberculosis]|nr:Uncharacterised protein [Mycobacterium tuberculosis]CFH53363.1 Uncharacterised protein [Mycobacterium tuberculosis]CLL44789.1 Uncharacterised protein [Mycobacterium tuberculosis]CLL56953.1 Uncharacterised protein [Mycobacterium tuberculosis]CLR90503.1 Uncharacterised protein [Mycobacterium tuberculosis]